MNYETLVRFRTMSDRELADIAIRMAELHPELFFDMVSGAVSLPPPVSRTQMSVPFTSQVVTFTDAELKELRSYSRDKKITCIKRIREITKIGLKEAKELCEAEFIPRSTQPMEF